MSLDTMAERRNKTSTGLMLIIPGALLLSFLLMIQYNYIDSFTNANSILVSERQIEFMNSIATPMFVFYMLCSLLIILGIVLVLKQKTGTGNESEFGEEEGEKRWKMLQEGLSFALNDKQTKKIVIIAFASYLSISLFLNNTILIQPVTGMGMVQNTFVPSIYVIGCCGSPGTFPVINIHITEFLGLKLIPVNLILPLFYSLLVSLSIALTVGGLSANKKGIRGCKTNKVCYMNSVGMVSGFLISCPSCITNIVISAIFGTGLMASAFTLIFPYHIAISTLSFVFMMVALYIAARFLYNSKKTIG